MIVFDMRLKFLEAKIARNSTLILASCQKSSQMGLKCQGEGGITAYMVRPYAPDGVPTVGAARIGRGAVLERRAATCGLQNP